MRPAGSCIRGLARRCRSLRFGTRGRGLATGLAGGRETLLFSFLPWLSDFFPPPDVLFMVAHARFSASFSDTPRCSLFSLICRACLFCFSLYADLSPLGIT